MTEDAYESSRLANGDQLIPDPGKILTVHLANFKCNSQLFNVISRSPDELLKVFSERPNGLGQDIFSGQISRACVLDNAPGIKQATRIDNHHRISTDQCAP